MTKAHGAFEVASWDEKTYGELEGGGKLSLASVKQDFTGDVTGDGAAQWLMCHRADGTAHFVGLQLVRGVVGESKGTFVLETSGDFDGTTATWTASVVPGSGTGELEGLSGRAEFGAPHGNQAAFDFDYQFE